jgi:hypothetical protein
MTKSADPRQIRVIRVSIHQEYRPRSTLRKGPRGRNSGRELHVACNWSRHAIWRMYVMRLFELLRTHANGQLVDKSSGSGREGEPSYSLDNFLETKTVLIKLS